ncbi:hypothetical protein [Clostridium felsineum]|uniref:Mom family adenine methylcarbamoylation protein n=1 Tax=Clostridium felsineum TaxID=36839 RepID=UPI00098C84C2|nr:hypothetical protein [Clostridium felsineum]URZ16907.1 hypothetical protein CLFE_029540 [Clostridium felsineum DSM 794]
MEKTTENKTYYMQKIDSKTANTLVKQYHYSHKVVSNSKLHLGVFSKNTTALMGVLSFGYPMNPKSTPQKIVKGSTHNEMYELNRMAMTDIAPKFSESQAIGLAVKWLKRYQPEIKWLLSFSDGKEGNVGTIYQATNWDYLGYKISDSFFQLDDQLLHNVQIWHRFKEGKPEVNTMQELYKHFNNVKKIKSRQHIYVFNLTKGHLPYRLELHPYPKKENEPRIVQEIIYKENGVILPKKQVRKYI